MPRIFAGNTRDHRTLGTMIDRLRERIELKEGATVVVDRGMAFDDNLGDIKARKLHYIVASRQAERNYWLAEFEDIDSFVPVLREPSPLNPAQKKTTIEVKVCAEDTDDETCVLCRSGQRIAKDRAIRAKHEQKLLADIEKLAQRVAKGRLVKLEKINQAIGRLREPYARAARYHPLSYDESRQSRKHHGRECLFPISDLRIIMASLRPAISTGTTGQSNAWRTAELHRRHMGSGCGCRTQC